MDSMLPILRQMHDAPDDRGRARLLLSCPDSVFLKYAEEFAASCDRAGFQRGVAYCSVRQASLRAVRDPETGELAARMFQQLDDWRCTMSLVANLPEVSPDPPAATDP